MTERTRRLSRRNFLLALGAGGAVTAAALVTSKQAPVAKSGAGKRSARGYHATEHVNNYYRTTKV